MRFEAYVFIDTENPGPRRVCQELRRIPGVVRADALFGEPDVIAIVGGDSLPAMDEVIDRIVGVDGVLDTDTQVCRPID